MPQEQDIAKEWLTFDEAKRTRLLGKMTPEQKKILRGKLEAKPAATPAAAPKPEGAATKLTRGAALGLFEGLGVKPSTSPGEVVTGSLAQFGGGIKDLVKETSEHNTLMGAAPPGTPANTVMTALDIIPTFFDRTADSLEAGGRQTIQDIKNRDWEAAAEHGTQTLTQAVMLRTGGKSESELSDVGKLRKSMREKFQPFVRKVTGVEPAVKDAVTKAAEKHSEALAERPAKLAEHARETVEVKKANTEAETAQSRKVALGSGVDKLSTELGSEINELDKKVRGEANEKYASVREKVGDATIPHEGLVDAVRKAESKLQGSAESVKVFRDIMGKAGDDVVVSGGKEFGPGTTLYESVKASPEGIPNAAKPVSFADLQGYYSELGDKLSSGNLPGDVYQAMKSLREEIGSKMQAMADSRGAGAELAQAQKFYHEYMSTFRDATGPSGSGSPVAQARLAKDPAYVRKPFTGDSGNRGVEMLAKYSPDLAKKARSIAKYQSEADAIPGRAPKVKEPPAMPSKPESPIVDISKAARDAIAQKAKNWGSFNARDIGILAASSIGGVLEAVLSGRGGYELPTAAVTYEAGKYAASRALNNPKVIEWLVKTPQEEIEVLNKIPGADKVKILNAITDTAVKSWKPIRLSPGARQLLGPANVARIMAVSGQHQPVKNRKEAIELLHAPN